MNFIVEKDLLCISNKLYKYKNDAKHAMPLQSPGSQTNYKHLLDWQESLTATIIKTVVQFFLEEWCSLPGPAVGRIQVLLESIPK